MRPRPRVGYRGPATALLGRVKKPHWHRQKQDNRPSSVVPCDANGTQQTTLGIRGALTAWRGALSCRLRLNSGKPNAPSQGRSVCSLPLRHLCQSVLESLQPPRGSQNLSTTSSEQPRPAFLEPGAAVWQVGPCVPHHFSAPSEDGIVPMPCPTPGSCSPAQMPVSSRGSNQGQGLSGHSPKSTLPGCTGIGRVGSRAGVQ